MTLNSQQFGDPPVPEGHTRLYRGEYAPSGAIPDPNRKKMLPWLEQRITRDRDKTINKVNGRWATADLDVAKLHPFDDSGSEQLVKFVDVPNHVYDKIKGLGDQPIEIAKWSANPNNEVIIPEEYSKGLSVSREHSPAKGLELHDNQDTYL